MFGLRNVLRLFAVIAVAEMLRETSRECVGHFLAVLGFILW